MKKRYFWIVLIVCLLFLVIGCLSRLPTGTLIKSSVSPNGTYVVNAYLCDGGATVDQAIRAEAVHVETGKSRNIYWQYHAYDAQIEWLDDNVVTVNGITLNVMHDMYDYRKQ